MICNKPVSDSIAVLVTIHLQYNQTLTRYIHPKCVEKQQNQQTPVTTESVPQHRTYYAFPNTDLDTCIVESITTTTRKQYGY